MARIETWFEQDLQKPLHVHKLDSTTFNQDNQGNLIGVKVFNNGLPANIYGSVTGYCILADNTTVPVPGTCSGNQAYIILPQAAYSVPGVISITVKLTDGSAVTTLAACVGVVVRSRTDNMVNPGSVLQDWTQQISQALQEVKNSVQYSVMGSFQINSEENAATNWPTKNWNDFPSNTIVVLGTSTITNQLNAPYSGATGTIITLTSRSSSNNGFQLFSSSNKKDLYFRYAFGANKAWGEWNKVSSDLPIYDANLSLTESQKQSARDNISAQSKSDAILTNGFQINSESDANRYWPTRNWDDLPTNVIGVIGTSGLSNIKNGPPENLSGIILSFANSSSNNNGIQLFVPFSRSNHSYYRTASGFPKVWNTWLQFPLTSDIPEKIEAPVVGSSQINSESDASKYWPTKNWNDFPSNTIVVLGTSTITNQLNAPYSGATGTIVTLTSRSSSNNGFQLFSSSNKKDLYFRYAFGADKAWGEWNKVSANREYYVGGSNEPSLVSLLLSLKNDTSEKTIYIRPGTYNILQEYRSNNIQTPPDSVAADDYFDYNVFLPPNTKLIGLGNVVLEMLPTTSQISVGESKTWAPLNIQGACHVENITIHVKNARYCIHDDYHGAYPNSRHIYKNVICISEQHDSGYGFNDTLGFGYENGGYYEFDGCVFINRNTSTSSPTIYGHDTTTTVTDMIANSATIVCKNCVFESGNKNAKDTIRFQSLARLQKKSRAYIYNSVINGGVHLTIYQDRTYQNFEVTIVKSGNPIITVDNPDSNPYPVKIYE